LFEPHPPCWQQHTHAGSSTVIVLAATIMLRSIKYDKQPL
jgi:hypothetical protein